DAGVFKRKDGSVLQVERDFHGHIGAPTCGPGASPNPVTAEAIALRNIACEAAQAHLFNVELTPDYNWPHRNHFHLEVTPSARYFLVH
ncbi:MAG TPA: extensin family protein, partial [Polyangiaceae bacterium]